jgi:hypothetical protein
LLRANVASKALRKEELVGLSVNWNEIPHEGDDQGGMLRGILHKESGGWRATRLEIDRTGAARLPAVGYAFWTKNAPPLPSITKLSRLEPSCAETLVITNRFPLGTVGNVRMRWLVPA